MSGTSLDGVDASIILSDGEKKLEIIDNYYEKYDDNFKFNLIHPSINDKYWYISVVSPKNEKV